MPAAKLNITLEQGATWRHSFALKGGSAANDPALNLAGYVARMQLRTDIPAPDVLLDMSTTNGRITVDALAGRLDLLLSAADTAALDFDRAVYDLEIESAGGEVTRVLAGTVTLSKQVTR